MDEDNTNSGGILIADADRWLDSVLETEREQLIEPAVLVHGLSSEPTLSRRSGLLVSPAGLLRDMYLFGGLTGARGYAAQDRALLGLQRLEELGWLIEESWRDQRGFRLTVPDDPMKRLSRRSLRGRRSRRRNPISRETKRKVFERDNWTCWLCGMPTLKVPKRDGKSGDWLPVVDHVIPHCEGGSDSAQNLATAHMWCNMLRGAGPRRNVTISYARSSGRMSAQDLMWWWLGEPEWTQSDLADLSMFSEAEKSGYLKQASVRMSGMAPRALARQPF